MNMGKILENIAQQFSLPANAAAGESFVSITGGKTVRIENHTGLFEYSDELIIIGASGRRISVYGAGMSLDAMNAVSAVISGEISSVSFE